MNAEYIEKIRAGLATLRGELLFLRMMTLLDDRGIMLDDWRMIGFQEIHERLVREGFDLRKRKELSRKFREKVLGRPENPTANALSAANGEISVEISKMDRVSGSIRNGTEGVITHTRIVSGNEGDDAKTTEILRFNGNLGPVLKIDDATPALKLKINGVESVFDLKDAVTFFRSNFALTTAKTQKLTEVLTAYIFGEIAKGNFEMYASSPITVIIDVITVKYEPRHDIAVVLRALREFYPDASHREAFVALFSLTLVAPLHDELKRRSIRGIQTPIGILTGKTRGGKTTTGNLFIGKGYSLTQDQYFYPYNRVATRFSLMKHLGETNLPALFDDLPSNWLLTHKEDLKSYVQTGHFGDRGRSDQTLTEYRGRRSFIGTINDDVRIDDDLALSMRVAILRFTEANKSRRNNEKFNATFDSLPDGFMYEIFRQIFEGKNINEILKVVEKFESVSDWINYGTKEINGLCQKNGIDAFPEYKEEENNHTMTNAVEVAQAFMGEWERIKKGEGEYFDKYNNQAVKFVKYRSPIEGEFKVEWRAMRNYIYFSSSAFKTLCARQQLKLPFSNASNFLNNISSGDGGVKVENEGKAKPARLGDAVFWAYCISTPVECDPDE